MNIKEILLTGLKIITAGAVGIFAFFGLGKLTKEKKEVVEEQQAVVAEGSEQALTEWGMMPVAQVGRETMGVTVINALSKAQSVTGKVTGLIQSISMFAESAVRLFDQDGAQRLNFQASTNTYRNREPGALDIPGMPPVGYEGVINGQRVKRPYENMIVLM